MWARASRLLGIVVVSVFLGYLIGSNVPGAGTAPASSGFLVGNLSVQPTQVQPEETATVTVSVANTHDTWGIYSLVLKINGVKEAETQANVGARSIEDVRFSVAKREPGRYRVFINGLSGSFTVVTLPEVPPVKWPLIGGIIGAVIVVALVIFFVVRRRHKER